MTRILLIDDDEKLGELLKAYFQRFDMQLDNAVRPSEGLLKIQRDKPDLVILDADPLVDVGNLAKVYRTIKGGVVYDPAELMRSLDR